MTAYCDLNELPGGNGLMAVAFIFGDGQRAGELRQETVRKLVTCLGLSDAPLQEKYQQNPD
jgi:hypothetical protein